MPPIPKFVAFQPGLQHIDRHLDFAERVRARANFHLKNVRSGRHGEIVLVVPGSVRERVGVRLVFHVDRDGVGEARGSLAVFEETRRDEIDLAMPDRSRLFSNFMPSGTMSSAR